MAGLWAPIPILDMSCFISSDEAGTLSRKTASSIPAAIKAVETVDTGLGKIAKAIESMGGALLVTADHGNAEMMVDPATGAPHTAHTLNPVPVLIANAPEWVTGLRNGRLSDIAPTVLALLGLPQPEAMTGRSLIVAERAVRAAGARASA